MHSNASRSFVVQIDILFSSVLSRRQYVFFQKRKSIAEDVCALSKCWRAGRHWSGAWSPPKKPIRVWLFAVEPGWGLLSKPKLWCARPWQCFHWWSWRWCHGILAPQYYWSKRCVQFAWFTAKQAESKTFAFMLAIKLTVQRLEIQQEHDGCGFWAAMICLQIEPYLHESSNIVGWSNLLIDVILREWA